MTQPLHLFTQNLLRWGMSLGRIYLLICVALYFLQGRFIFAPTRNIEETPKDYQLPYQDITLNVKAAHWFGDKVEKLHGWWIPSSSKTFKISKTLLYLHGNGLNISANTEQASRFNNLGLSVFLFDYRGYGLSEGSFPSETSVYADANRAWSYLTQERKIAPENIVIYGHSLGGAIAIDLAHKQPKAGGLIVQSSFTSAVDMARRNWWTAVFPVNLLLTQRFASLEKVPALQMPALYIHGVDDDLIPFAMSQRLFEATPTTKQLKFFAKAGHNNVAEVGGTAYTATVQSFLDAVDRATANRITLDPAQRTKPPAKPAP